MEWTSTILAIAALVFFIQALTWKTRAKNKRLPPGPRGLPILGNLLMIGTKPHQDLQRLARKPPQEASKYISYNQQNLVFAPYGSFWRNMRKMCTLELLSNHKISTFRSTRKQELDLLVRHIREVAYSGVAVDLSSMVTSFSTDVSCRMIIGKKYDRDDFGEKGFEATVRETMRISSAFNLADYIPQIRGLDLQGQAKRMKAIAKDFDDFFEKILEEHVESKDENRTKDFIDVMLGFMGSEETEYRVERDTIKAIILDMLAASMDTSAATIDWTLVELIRHPRVTKKLQQELENVATELDMTEEFGIVCPRTEHLQAIPTWRLNA
ncbi:hypothetical protein V6N13_028041 [Hibiscus sabdariffa]